MQIDPGTEVALGVAHVPTDTSEHTFLVRFCLHDYAMTRQVDISTIAYTCRINRRVTSMSTRLSLDQQKAYQKNHSHG